MFFLNSTTTNELLPTRCIPLYVHGDLRLSPRVYCRSFLYPGSRDVDVPWIKTVLDLLELSSKKGSWRSILRSSWFWDCSRRTLGFVSCAGSDGPEDWMSWHCITTTDHNTMCPIFWLRTVFPFLLWGCRHSKGVSIKYQVHLLRKTRINVGITKGFWSVHRSPVTRISVSNMTKVLMERANDQFWEHPE